MTFSPDDIPETCEFTILFEPVFDIEFQGITLKLTNREGKVYLGSATQDECLSEFSIYLLSDIEQTIDYPASDDPALISADPSNISRFFHLSESDYLDNANNLGTYLSSVQYNVVDEAASHDGGYSVTYNAGGVPTFTLRSQIGFSYYIHQIVDSAETTIALKVSQL